MQRKMIGLLLCSAAISCGSAQTGQLAREAVGNSQPIATQPASVPQLQTATVGPFKLHLTECQLTYQGASKTGKVRFDFPVPCQFGSDRKGDVRVVRTGKTHTLVVESSRPADAADPLSSRDCITWIRGVVVTPQEIRLSVQIQKVAQCLPAVWDEKMFHAFAARTQPADDGVGK